MYENNEPGWDEETHFVVFFLVMKNRIESCFSSNNNLRDEKEKAKRLEKKTETNWSDVRCVRRFGSVSCLDRKTN